MPIYVMQCQCCDHREEIYRSIAKMNDDLPECCDKLMRRAVTAPMVAGDIQPYISQCDGSVISSRSQHRAHLRQHGVIEMGNEKPKPRGPIKAPPGLKETLIRVANEKLK